MAGLNSSQFPDSITAAQLRDLLRTGRQKRAAIVYEPFEYADRDRVEAELNELFSYEERAELAKLFERFSDTFPEKTWKNANDKVRREFVMLCLDKLDTAVSDAHQQWAECLLYIAMGDYDGCASSEELLERIVQNTRLLRRYGVVPAIISALDHTWSVNGSWQLVAVYLRILGIIMIVHESDPRLAEELAHPRRFGCTAVILFFDMLGGLSDGRLPRGMPLQKLMACLRLSILTCWGDLKKLERLKAAARAQACLPPVKPGMYAKHTMDDLVAFERDTVSRYYGVQPLRKGAKTLADLEETLPVPILEGLRTLRANVYVSLGEVQLKTFLKERLPAWPWPPSAVQPPPDMTALLHDIESIRNDLVAMTHSLPRTLVSMLKLLLAAIPAAKKTPGSVSLMNDFDMTPRMAPAADANMVELTAQQTVDANRYREILSKSIAAVFLLLLKHARVVHVLQFELISQILVDNNGLLLLLRFFNQDLALQLSTKNELAPYSFLSYAVEPRERLEEHEFALAGRTEVEINSAEDNHTPIYVSWRTTHTTVDMLRILQKLTKRKLGRVRIMMDFKAPTILKRLVKMPHDKLAYYALKAIKSQLPYLGRKWRSANMKVVSAIYMDLRSRSQDAALLSVNSDMDGEELPPAGVDDMGPVLEEYVRTIGPHGLRDDLSDGEGEDDHDTNLLSLSLRNIDLGLGFEQNYSAWLASEVYVQDDDEDDESSGFRARPASPTTTS